MAENTEPKQILAHFTVQGTDHAGALTFDGQNTKLDIFSDEFLHLKDDEMNCVRGVSKEGVSISAINCVPLVLSGSASYHGRERRYLTLSPNYVVLGPCYIDSSEPVIASIAFTFSQANHLFYDWGTFGHIRSEQKLTFGQRRALLRGVRNRPKHRRRGGHLDLYYRWDRGPIIEAACALGTITAWNATRERNPSPEGLDVENRTRVTVQFSQPLILSEALRVRHLLMVLMELLAQGRQNVTDIRLQHTGLTEGAHLDFFAMSEEHKEVEELMPTDALINGGLHEEEFTRVLIAWMDSTAERGAARRRFIDNFRRGRSFNTDRLVGAANAFDILPATDFAKQGALPPEVGSLLAGFEKEIKEKAKSIAAVKEYRERLLNNLGLVRGLNLRSKVLQRWSSVPSCITTRLPGMPEAIAHSVRARNFFVHGTSINMTTEDLYSLAPFFTDTLEFVFGVSELCLCGWDADRWIKEGYHASRYKWYISNFPDHLKRLEVAIAKGKPPVES
ncbi:hypothetical protein [Bradyrhizobium erythrophlei]|uniref:Uncharacterized protein n=1 Tax=Bradyrhizobium erythrophlei TaxID=1437360 RepID=A0A1H4Z7D3_9BRAD|nr:hypothetical protein [Bradyrhizobium erythrophlei]SED25334.1 hypothetical protein SAMN05444164_4234 [Bradyrhizobium erythrophlei]